MYSFNETDLSVVYKSQFKYVLTVVIPDTQKKKSSDKAEITFSPPFLVCCPIAYSIVSFESKEGWKFAAKWVFLFLK